MKKEKQQTQETQEVLDSAVAIEVGRPSLAAGSLGASEQVPWGDGQGPIDGVSRAQVFRTDAFALVSAVRSEWVQTQVGARGGAGYDGDHSFANFAGGGGEYINMEAMLRDLNRGAGDSFFNIENGLRRILDQNPAVQISMTIRKSFSGDGRVPDALTAVYSIDGSTPIIKIFENG